MNIRKHLIITLLVGILTPFQPLLAGGPADKSTTPDVSYGWPVSDYKLVRNDRALNVMVSLSGLPIGNAYTMWWIVDEYDDDGNWVDELWVNASGGISDDDGELTMAGHLGVGPLVEGDLHPAQVLWAGFDDSAFTTPRTANVFFVVIDHGEKIPGLVNEQISTFEGGCDVNECVEINFFGSCGTSPGYFEDC